MENKISEPVDVIAYFHSYKIEIVKFRWKNTIYNVSSVNSKWKIKNGDNIEFHFSVNCKKQKVICELAYNLSDFEWYLIQYENI